MGDSYNTTSGGRMNIMNDLATAWRLLWDPRVPMLLKLLLPVAAMVYWISPIDLMAGLPFDDIALMILALKLFINMAPQAAGEPASGGATANQNNSYQSQGFKDDDVIDTTWQVIDD